MWNKNFFILLVFLCELWELYPLKIEYQSVCAYRLDYAPDVKERNK